jgi:uncharacterized protein DUF4440
MTRWCTYTYGPSVVIALIVTSVRMAAPLAGQSGNPAVRRAMVADSILQLDRAWGQAYVHGDSLLVKNLLAPDWRGWYDDAGADKASELAEWRAGSNHTLEDIIDSARVRIFGGTAIVQARERVRVADTAGEHWETRHITDVFVHQHGRWLVEASHDSPVPNSPP